MRCKVCDKKIEVEGDAGYCVGCTPDPLPVQKRMTTPTQAIARLRAIEQAATKAPWTMDAEDLSVRAVDRQMRVADIRGWGFLTGTGARGMDEATAAREQDGNGLLIAALRNAVPALLDVAEAAANVQFHRERCTAVRQYCCQDRELEIKLDAALARFAMLCAKLSAG